MGKAPRIQEADTTESQALVDSPLGLELAPSGPLCPVTSQELAQEHLSASVGRTWDS